MEAAIKKAKNRFQKLDKIEKRFTFLFLLILFGGFLFICGLTIGDAFYKVIH